MDSTLPDPIAEVEQAIGLEVEHLRRSENVNARDELQLRIYPLLRRMLSAVVERIDAVYDDFAAPQIGIPAELAGRVVAILIRYVETVNRCAKPDGERPTAEIATELEAEAQAVASEIASLFGPEQAAEASPPANDEASHG